LKIIAREQAAVNQQRARLPVEKSQNRRLCPGGHIMVNGVAGMEIKAAGGYGVAEPQRLSR
jgi:hypothetical protein